MKALLLVLLTTAFGLADVRAQERFETLEVGHTVYENVEVLDKTETDLFIRHSRGACNIKLVDLPDELKTALGYVVEERRGTIDLTTVEMDPRIQEMNVKLAEEVESMMKGAAPVILFGLLGACFALYLFVCYCFKLICQKAGSPPSFLIWIPLLQWFPLFRAAGMSGWATLALLAPQIFAAVASLKLPSELTLDSPATLVFLGIFLVSLLLPFITMIMWSVKICRARGKSGLVALFLLLPFTNLFAFLYLAFSGTQDPEDVGHAGFVKFS